MIKIEIQHDFSAFLLGVSFSLAPGEALGLFGPSGSGKSTTLRAIAGLLKSKAGRITIGERVIFDSNLSTWIPPHLRRISYMPQHYALFPHLSVAKNVTFGLDGWTRDSAMERAAQLFSMLHIADLTDRYPSELSHGQQQRVALARALAPKPELLLLDEPFAALDQNLRLGLRRELQALRLETGVPLILVTHDWADILALCDRVLVLEEGSVVEDGPPVEIFERPRPTVLSRVTAVENVFEGTVTDTDRAAGVMTCTMPGFALEIPLADVHPGIKVRVGVRANDIIIATSAPQGLSARNLLPATIVSISERGFQREVLAECGDQVFRVTLTPRAIETLALTEGSTAWLVIKGTSCFVIE